MLTTTLSTKIVEKQRQFFNNGKTQDIDFRKEQLQKLKNGIINHKNTILKALKADLNKPEFEGYLEIITIREIDYALKQIKSWVKPKKVRAPLDQFPASALIYPEPLGVVLIIGAWNYPFNLTICPLIGAIAAGNCAVVKPSEIAPNTSAVVAELIDKTFDASYITVVEGGAETNQQLLAEKFDHIFFTGSTRIGKIIMEAAAKNLTPVTLELGGKSPCIVEEEINLIEAAKRIIWGKFINAGQTCVAPDYLLVNHKIKPDLVAAIKNCIQQFYGEQPTNSPDYARIVNEKQFNRLVQFLSDGKIIVGGETNADDRYIAPTVMENVSLESPLMQEEIFGPILPILEYEEITEAIALINSRPKPLALYLFTNNKTKQEQILQATSSGGVCINDTNVQFSVSELPFGGVGNSGIGSYHGKASFDTFSHYKSVLKKSLRFKLNVRYAPYQGKLKQLKWLLGLK